MRIVLDTSVLVSAFRSHSGASRGVLRLVAAKHLRLVASSALYLEYDAVLTRPEQINRAPDESDGRVMMDILDSGIDNPPEPGDELPDGYISSRTR